MAVTGGETARSICYQPLAAWFTAAEKPVVESKDEIDHGTVSTTEAEGLARTADSKCSLDGFANLRPPTGVFRAARIAPLVFASTQRSLPPRTVQKIPLHPFSRSKTTFFVTFL